MTDPSRSLVDLAHAYGVMTEYVDWRGRTVEVSAETITAVLGAMAVSYTHLTLPTILRV